MLLRNYYASVVSQMVNQSLTVDTSVVNPISGKAINGNAITAPTSNELYAIKSLYANSIPGSNIYQTFAALGTGTNEVNFDDYSYSVNSSISVSTSLVSSTSVYDDNTKTCIATYKYTVSNKSSTDSITFNELAIGYCGAAGSSSGSNSVMIMFRQLLGNNSFTLEPLESANLEIVIKYTIPQPLQ